MIVITNKIFSWFLSVLFWKLLLRWIDLLDHDPGHRVPPGISIGSGFLPHAIPDIYSHSDCSPGDSLAVSCNLSYFVHVEVCFAVVTINVNNTINGKRTVAFAAIEGEEPALTAIQAKRYPEIAIVLHLQSCIMGLLGKNTVLLKSKKVLNSAKPKGSVRAVCSMSSYGQSLLG